MQAPGKRKAGTREPGVRKQTQGQTQVASNTRPFRFRSERPFLFPRGLTRPRALEKRTFVRSS